MKIKPTSQRISLNNPIKKQKKTISLLVYFVSNSEIQGKVSSLSDTNRLHDVACDP